MHPKKAKMGKWGGDFCKYPQKKIQSQRIGSSETISRTNWPECFQLNSAITDLRRDCRLPRGAGAMGDPGEVLNNEQPCRLFLSSPAKAALAPRQGSVA